MKLGFEFRLGTYKRDKSVPSWAKKVRRWNQLDDEAFIVAEACEKNLDFIGNPSRVVIVSPLGSTQTDLNFAHSETLSPSDFVHTLPNVRSISLSQITGWCGEVFCFSSGYNSLIKSLINSLCTYNENEEVLIISLIQNKDNYFCDLYKITEASGQMWNWQYTDKNCSDQDIKINDLEFREEIRSLDCKPIMITEKNYLELKEEA